ncbi:G5 domain-containing protein [Bacillus tianshenii]|uniref:G5 domain-containing protein n=1 Tax=Sutcliffiella tianshenii TaxID=1463404 RepID=UPI001CD32E0A|nr:G5 domain-containing protein [Bacillus tianshenii]MCA1318743.1 G5 domain-containing protein [Bacillus tianshenii]
MQSLKTLLALLVCTAFIFSFSFVAGMITDEWLPHKSAFSEQTLIASEEVSNKSKEEAVKKLEAAKDSWLQNGTIFLEWSGELQPFDKNHFTFYIPESVDYAQDSSSNTLKVELESSILLAEIETLTNSPDIFASLDSEKLLNDLMAVATVLDSDNHTFSVLDYLLDDSLVEKTTIDSIMKVSDEKVLKELKEGLSSKEMIVPAGQVFSVHDWLLKENVMLSDEASSIVASMIYQLSASTNFNVLERHISSDLPEWAVAGYEARMERGKMDLVLENPNKNNFTVTFSIDSSTLLGTLNGPALPYVYKIEEENKESYSPKTIVQYSASLLNNQKKVKEEGKDGVYVKLQRVAKDAAGTVVETASYSEDFYPPIHRIEQHSLIRNTVASNPGNSDSGSTPGNTNDSGSGNTGGSNTGGSNTGSSNTGGTNTGGTNTGGTNTGNSNTSGGNTSNTGDNNNSGNTNTGNNNNNENEGNSGNKPGSGPVNSGK